MKKNLFIPALVLCLMFIIALSVYSETFNSIESTNIAASATATTTSGTFYLDESDNIWVTSIVENTASATVTLVTQGRYGSLWHTVDSVGFSTFGDSLNVYQRMIRNKDTNRLGASDYIRTKLTVTSGGDSTAQIFYLQNIEAW